MSQISVVGGGLMGSGIAEAAAASGHDVALFEPVPDSREASQRRLAASVERGYSTGKLSDADAHAVLERVTYVDDMEELTGSQLVIEAVIEDLEVKASVFRRLDQVVGQQTLLASNTSSIPIASLASEVSNPGRVLGLHFFSPAPVMKLVEVVRALDTSDDAIAEANRFVHTLGKTPIATKDRSGFVVNMLLVPYLVAAIRMLEEGFASREDIDTGMRLGCGHPMGPLTLCDFIGLDVIYAVCDSLYEEFKQAAYAPPPLLKRMVASGRLGRKSGHGFYEYEEKPIAAFNS